MNDDNPQYRQCLKKRAYKTRNVAIYVKGKSMKRIQEELHVYKCPYKKDGLKKHYHIGHRRNRKPPSEGVQSALLSLAVEL